MKKITKDKMLTETSKLHKYFNFSDGVNIADSELKKFINKGINQATKKIKEGYLKESFASISSGNAAIFVEIYRQKNNLFTIYVNVTRNYKGYSEVDVEL